MRNKIRGIQSFHHGPSKDDDPKSLNQHRSEEDLDKKLSADYATQSERGMSDAEYRKYFAEGSIHNSNLPEVDVGVANNTSEKSTYTKVLDGVNTGLTLGGMTPGYGLASDAANFLFSGARTLSNAVSDTANGLSSGSFNYNKTKSAAVDTAWAAAGAVPAAGIGFSGGRLTAKGIKASKNAFMASGKANKFYQGLDKIHHLKMYQPTKASKIINKYMPDSPNVNASNSEVTKEFDTINPTMFRPNVNKILNQQTIKKTT